MITPMQMYWILKLDDFGDACSAFVLLLLGLSAVGFSLFVFAREDDNEKVQKIALKSFCLALIGALFFGVVKTFLPSTKQMATIYIVPAIANNEKIQQIGGKTLDITNQLLDLTKDYLSEKAADNGK